MGASKIHQYQPSQLHFARTAKAIGHPARIAIMQYLAEHGFTSNKYLCNVVGLSVPTVSQHMDELKKAGLIEEYFIGSEPVLKLNRDAEKMLENLQTILQPHVLEQNNTIKH